ncbi:hypothetical protein N8I77_006963 [Diaporthe amygdali]|uniref:Uncharacterized protein n=1 Tax=Phomopsis amygdali TaxID=1214568 RepID=A0AAD9SIF4_PHOAM|nr:hypothetical protein N8I77_006963 [Diaporthe amygdali]
MDGFPQPLTLRTRAIDRRFMDRSFERVHTHNDADNSLDVASADAAEGDAPRILPYQQRSLANHPTLRRKPSELHLRSNAIARLGIPEAEARLALEASRVRGGLHRSVSDLDLAERRPFYPPQFDKMPYDPKRNADDQIINQLLLDWTPQWTGLPRATGPRDMETGQKTMSDDETEDYEGREDLSPFSVIEDDYYGSSEHSTIRGHILKTHKDREAPGVERQAEATAEAESRVDHQEQVENEPRLAWGNDSTAEIERLEEQLATLKFKRNAKRADIGLLSKVLNHNTERRAGERPTAEAAQTTKPVHLTTSGQDDDTDDCSGLKMPAVQRRVTMDEVEDEDDTKMATHNHPPSGAQDGDDELTKPARASMFPTAVQTSKAELEWAQRVLQDSAALSEPTDPERAEIEFRSQSRRDVRAARRESSKRRESSRRPGSDRGRLQKRTADQKVQEWRERQKSHVRSPERPAGFEDDKETRP